MNGENEAIVNDVQEEISAEAVAAKAPSDSSSPASAEDTESVDNTDYEEILNSDMRELSEEFSENVELKITDLKNPIRYGALRDLGLTPTEAFLASGGKKERADNRAHLSSSVPRKMASSFSEIPRSELAAARELFEDMNDSEIRSLYKKVTQ